MMRPFDGALGLAVFFHLIGLILAAGPIIPRPSLNDIPPDPCQFDVYGTTTKLIFSHFSKPIRQVDEGKLNNIIARAQ